LDHKLDFLTSLVDNLLFLFFNLGIFYAIYWAFREDSRMVKEEKEKRKNLYHKNI